MRRTLAAFLLVALPLPTFAQQPFPTAQQPFPKTQQPVAALSACLADSTSGRDRKDLARWIFLSMAAHPEIKQYAGPGVAQTTDDANKTTAALLTRLLAESCATQTKAAVKQGGSQAVQTAFAAFGQLAMQELMSNAEVSAAMGAFEKYIDQAKMNQALSGN